MTDDQQEALIARVEAVADELDSLMQRLDGTPAWADLWNALRDVESAKKFLMLESLS